MKMNLHFADSPLVNVILFCLKITSSGSLKIFYTSIILKLLLSSIHKTLSNVRFNDVFVASFCFGVRYFSHLLKRNKNMQGTRGRKYLKPKLLQSPDIGIDKELMWDFKML